MESIGHYRIISKLGEGGMGQVFRATDTKLGRDVAVKVLPEGVAEDPDRMARFTREAHLLASLNHPNIATIYGVEERTLVMELIEGLTLEERIAQGPMPLAEALPVARQIADALEYAHEKGVVHRDLKPANIKITPQGQAKVLDFGLAKALSNDPAAAANPNSSPTLTMRATLAGAIMGTAAYMSPEQARGLPVDRRADIWSFGVTLFEMLTGRQLFGGPTVSDSLAAVLKTDPDWSALPADVPAPIRRLLRRSLERDRKRRLSDIADARLEIDEALAASPESPVVAVAVPTKQRGFPWVTAAASLVAMAGIAVSVVHFREEPRPPAPVRFQFPVPEKGSFGPTGLAVSPDGSSVAFIASGADNKQVVWLRPIDALAAYPLPGTEGAGFTVFWSPDSRQIGFGVLGKLKKLSVSGGPVQTLAELPDSIVGGSWSHDGVILFGSNAGGLYRVSQLGGTPTQVTKSDPNQGEVGHLRPWFLPDGQHFLYITRVRQDVTAGIFVGSLDGKTARRLTDSARHGVYAPPVAGSKFGHLLFLRESSLMALALHPTRFEPFGEPFPVAEQVGGFLAMGLFSVSNNGVLAYRSGTAGGTHPIWFDRQGKPQGALGAPAISGSVALSPDGKRVALDRRETAAPRQNIWTMDTDRGLQSRFTFGESLDLTPVWSPDGHKLYYASERAGTFDIYQKDSNGAGNEELLWETGARSARLGNWSPDGRNLVYSAIGDTTRLDIWVYSAAERKGTKFLSTPAGEAMPQFSPDGRWIAYASDEGGEYQIYVQSFPIGAGKFQISAAGGTQPRWRKDGKQLYYVAADGKLMAVDIQAGATFAHGIPQPLFAVRLTNQVNLFRYDVAPDGSRFLVNTTAGDGSGEESPVTVVLNWQAAVKSQ